VAMDPIPDVGQHTDAILAELGFENDALERWHASGVI
jgi:crotonobetainyl-CoA:carnitine CoA-transferase CaiB-like acyl-CoA transferase